MRKFRIECLGSPETGICFRSICMAKSAGEALAESLQFLTGEQVREFAANKYMFLVSEVYEDIPGAVSFQTFYLDSPV